MDATWPLVGRSEELDALGAALADPVAWGVAICGPVGVGKTRLAERCLAAMEAAGRRVVQATASPAAAAVPLGALVHLLPPDLAGDQSDPLSLFDRVARELRSPDRGARLVLFVDDLHLLDATSVVLLGQLLTAGVLGLMATVRTGLSVPDTAAELWRSDRMARVDLGNLSRDDLETLLHLALAGPVGSGTVADLWAASRGNPLFVRELVLGAQATGVLVEQDGVWRLTGRPATTARLADVIEARLPPVGAPGRTAVELLAVAEPVDIAELEDLVAAEVLEDLERACVVDVQMDRRRHRAVLAHPLYGEVVRTRLPALARRRLLLDHAGWIERTGARRRGDPLKIAMARLDATGSGDPGLLLAAARLARYGHDHAQVVRLARAVLDDGAIPEAQLLLGEALYEQGMHDAAEEVLAAAEQAATDDPHLVAIVATRVRNLVWGLTRPHEALAVNRAARDRSTNADVRNELTADEAIVLMVSGRPADALGALVPLTDTTSPRVRVLRAIAEVPALIQSGRSETALGLARQGFSEHVELGDQLAIAHPAIHLLNQAAALAEAGRLSDATALAGTCYEHAARQPSPTGRMWFALLLGRCALLSGRATTARRWLGEAATLSRDAGLVGPQRVALAALAMAAAWRGDAPTAQAVVNELDGLPDFGYLRAEQELGRAWVHAVAGFPQEARDVLAAAAEEAAESAQHSAEAWLLHDLARLGAPGRAWERLETLASRCEGPLIAAYAVHARALTRRSPRALTEAADRFHAIGAILLAAEAATEAGHAHQRDGQPRSAAAAHTRAAALAAKCEGARTPGLLSATTIVPLTRREREIAVLASDGIPNRDIAQRLYLSVRTVHSHLHNAYTKLGVTNRNDLAAALQDSETATLKSQPARRRPSSPQR